MKKERKIWKKPVIKHGKLTKYNYVVQYPENLKMGKNFDIGTFTYINCRYDVKIEDGVQIGSHCSIYSHSTIDAKKGPVILKKNCKIGTHSTIMPNVTIGENSVVGAYSFVNRNVPRNQIWIGIPAHFKAKIKKINS
ncbi:MAG: acyltransferase [Nitrosopumilaceae archaeon]